MAGKQERVRFTDLTCPACGIACDDIEVEMGGDTIATRNSCMIGDARFQELYRGDRLVHPVVCGERAGWAEALETAAAVLAMAKRPLVFIGGEESTEAMAAGIEIAELLGGLVDGNTSLCHGPTILGHQYAGQAGCTLGECRNRSDLAIYWGFNPADSHPRHMSRHSMYARGFFVEQGYRGRKMVVVDPRRTPTAAQADLHVQLKPGRDYELLDALMVALRGGELDDTVEGITGVSEGTIKKLAQMIKECKFGVLWVGLGIASSAGKHRNAAMAMRLVQLCNDYTKFSFLVNRVNGNDAGFNQVLTWTAGFPFAVDYSRGVPRYQPGEYTCVDALARHEVDAMLVVGGDLAGDLPMRVVRHMMDVPIISIQATPGPQAFVSDVILPGVLEGMECEGTFFRMDNVPVRARGFARPPFDFTASNEDTLRQLSSAIRRKIEARPGR